MNTISGRDAVFSGLSSLLELDLNFAIMISSYLLLLLVPTSLGSLSEVHRNSFSYDELLIFVQGVVFFSKMLHAKFVTNFIKCFDQFVLNLDIGIVRSTSVVLQRYNGTGNHDGAKAFYVFSRFPEGSEDLRD